MSIVVTGATGHLGRLVIDELLTRVPAAEVAAAVRDPDKAADLAARGVELRTVDYNRPETLKDAFHPGDRVLLISGSEVGRRVAQHSAVVDAAKEAGVAVLAYTGVLGGPEADFALAEEHRATEAYILDSGLPYAFLRNGWYTEVYTENLAPVLEHGAVVRSAGDGRVATASRGDYAAAAAVVLADESRWNQAYELSGDTAWNHAEYAALLSELTGREIVHKNVSDEDYAAMLTGAGLPAEFVAILVDVEDGIARGRLALTNGDLARLIGRPSTPLRESVAAALKG
jgi:NAD(P)H dehydrogenase (quinone)